MKETEEKKESDIPSEKVERLEDRSVTPPTMKVQDLRRVADTVATYPIGSKIEYGAWEMYQTVRALFARKRRPIYLDPDAEKGILGKGGFALIVKGKTLYRNGTPLKLRPFAYKIPLFDLMNTGDLDHDEVLSHRFTGEDAATRVVRSHLEQNYPNLEDRSLPGLEQHVVESYGVRKYGPVLVKMRGKEKYIDLWFGQFELVKGRNLHEVHHDEKLPLPVMLDYMITLSDVLHAANETGYFHRDIKPANIMISDEGVVKLGDFGLARRIDNHGAVSIIMGSPGYSAPEQLSANDDLPIDGRVDIYSLGASLYFLLTGDTPYDEFGDLRRGGGKFMVHSEAQPAYERNSDVPQGLSELVGHCIQSRRDDRIQTMKEVGDLLREERKKLS
jgi:serine/threonine protein kinase